MISSSLPPSDPVDSLDLSDATGEESIDTQMLKALIISRRQVVSEDAEMLGSHPRRNHEEFSTYQLQTDMETQMQPPCDAEDDPIRSFPTRRVLSRSGSLTVSQMGGPLNGNEPDGVVNCECGVTVGCSTDATVRGSDVVFRLRIVIVSCATHAIAGSTSGMSSRSLSSG